MSGPSLVEDIFLAALEKSTPEERATFLDAACKDNPDMRHRVERLLEAHPKAGNFLEPPARPASEETMAYVPTDEQVGTVIGGKYKLVEKIGEGGMGSVWMAQQMEPVKRAVAVKLIKAGMDSRAVLARFEAERQALAMMDHPNIAKVLDAGATASGSPFFVMELVKGVPITQFCDERKLTPRQRLELFVPVCQAIQHAHQKGIIHRDIKPNNVLIALYDDRAVPKVIDFGIAKAAGQSLTDKTLMTGFGAVVGTPEYMSPEQANLNNLDIDTRSDVYSLGVLLYELLTGTTPVDRKSLGKAALLEVLRIVREVEATRPSNKLLTADTLPSVAANRGTEPAKLSKLMKGELDWVVLKALEKDRTRRYDSANGLARDVQRYLADEVVEARPPSTGYRLRRSLRRNKGRLVTAAVFLMVLLGGTVVSTWQAAERKREQAESRWEQERVTARTRQAVQLQLDRAEAGLKVHQLGDVTGALGQAKLLLADADDPDLQDRFAAVKKDLDTVLRLDDIFAWRWNLAKGQVRLFPNKAKQLYPPALSHYGLAIGEEPAETVVRAIRRSAIADALRMALEQWFFLEPAQPGLRAVLDADDPDPIRSNIRAAVASGNMDRVRQLAEKADLTKFSPEFATALGMYLPVEQSQRLMKAVWNRWPDSFPLAITIATRLTELDLIQGNAMEAVGWCRIAVAIRPNSAFAHHCLGVALGETGDKDGQSAELREAMRLAPRFARAGSVLAFDLYYKQGKREEAFDLYKSLVEVAPNSAPGHAGLCRYYVWKGKWTEAAAEYLSLFDALNDPNYNGDDSCFDDGTSKVCLDRNEAILAGFLAEGRLSEAFGFGEQVIRKSQHKVWGCGDCATALFRERVKGRPLSETELPKIRQKALEWFAQGLSWGNERYAKDPATADIHRWIEMWLTDGDLASVRDENALVKLPADERASWQKLWADVRSLRDRTASAKSPPPIR